MGFLVVEAERLVLGQTTVRTYVAAILSKLSSQKRR